MIKRQNKLWGICASLGFHGLAAAILMFSLSGNAMLPQNPGSFDFMWVSVAAKQSASLAKAKENRGSEIPPMISRPGAKPEYSATENVLPEPVTTIRLTDRASGDITSASSSGVAVHTPENGHASVVSPAMRRTETSEATPVYSRAYPLYKENPPPGYPEMARREGYEGVVLVQAEILANGHVGKTIISKSSGYAILDQTAVKAVRDWKFEPAKKSGIPCKAWAELPIKFVISNHHSPS